MTSVLQICFCFAITSRQHNLGQSDQSYFKTYHCRAQLNNSTLATFTKIRASFIGDEKCISWQRGNNYGEWRYQCRTGWQLENDGLFSAGNRHLSLNSLHLCGLPNPRTWFGMLQVNIPKSLDFIILQSIFSQKWIYTHLPYIIDMLSMTQSILLPSLCSSFVFHETISNFSQLCWILWITSKTGHHQGY